MHSMDGRRAGALCLLALAAVLGGCGEPAGDQPTTLRLGYFPNVTHAPAIVGVEQGSSPTRSAPT